MTRINFFAVVITALTIWACTPKVAETVKESTPEVVTPATPPTPEVQLSECDKFSDAPNYDEAKKNYVLYRDFLNSEEWSTAFDYWQKVYKVAPAADGRRSTVYFDGISFYEHFIYEETDSLKIREHTKSILALYDEAARCYPKEKLEINAYKAFDLYYNYTNHASYTEIYAMVKEIVDKEGNQTPAFILNVFADLLVNLHIDESIQTTEAKIYYDKIEAIIDNGTEKCKGEDCAEWQAVESYVASVSEYFENVEGFFDCAYFVEKYYQPVVKGETDCADAKEMLFYLNKGQCAADQPEFAEVDAFVKDNCIVKGNLRLGYEALANGEYKDAIKYFDTYVNDDKTTIEKRAKYQMVIAKLYYGQVRNFRKSRQYALAAAKNKPNWGDPYLLIGRLYASSGPLCGPGRGWDSQIVVWPAIDKWNKAMKIDPSCTKEARKWINKYAQYMPSPGDLHQRSLKEGQPFRVDCWIQENTVIRAAR